MMTPEGLGDPDTVDVGADTGLTVDDTERRILMAAVQLVDEHGEAGLRISDLVAASGRSVGSIYHFFGNREGVIEAVRVHRFHPTWDEDLAAMRMVNDHAESLDELLDAVEALQTEFVRAERDDVLWQRVDAIGSARSRPSLRLLLAERQREQTAAFEEMIRGLQAKGIVGTTVDVHAAAVFVQAFRFGRILSVLDGTDRLSPEEWSRTTRRAVEAVLKG
ncbi:MAG: TetR/AcrR family transcriptional regulator [Actinomycetes bacterium]